MNPAGPGRSWCGGGPELERQGQSRAAGCRVWLAFCGWGWPLLLGLAPPPVGHHSLRASQPAMGPGRKVAQVPASPVVAADRAAQQAPGWPGPHPLAVGRRHATGQGRHQCGAGQARHQQRSRGTPPTPTPAPHPRQARPCTPPGPPPAETQGGMGGLLASRYR